MRKLFKLKNWYSLDDAAARLTLTLNEPITVQDIRQLMGDGHIAAYWNIQSKTAREVAPVTKIYSERDVFFRAMMEVGNIPATCKQIRIEDFEPQQPYVEDIDGLFKIDAERSEAVTAWLKALALNKEPDHTSPEGTLLVGNDGRMWQLMAPFSKNECATSFEKKKPVDDPDNFYPEFYLPEPSDIVISKSEIEAFEAQWTEPAAEEKPLGTRERNSLLSIIAVLCEAHGYEVARAAKTAVAIRESAELAGIDIGETTIEKHLKMIPDVVRRRAL
jgi:hypothetical protein